MAVLSLAALPLAALSLAALSLAGCAGQVRRVETARDLFAAGKLGEARNELQRIVDRSDRFAAPASLDLAIVDLASGNVTAAESRLRKLRDQFDRLPKLAPVREAASMVTDDTARVFRPAGHEEVMIRAMLALCSLAGDGIDAESYALQAAMRQDELARDATERGLLDVDQNFQMIALAPYLRGILREATHRDYDDAAKAYQLVSAVRPEFLPAQADVARASGGAHSAAGHGVLYVIACVGRGPVLRETTAPTTSTALAIAGSLLQVKSDADQDFTLPNIASVNVPAVHVPPTDVAVIGVRSDGTALGVTQTLTDVGQLAQRQCDAEMPWTIARAVARRATKEIAVAKAGDAIGLGGNARGLFQFAAASAWSGVEQADTRCWGLLPREVQVLRVELPAGAHRIELCSVGFAGEPLGRGIELPVHIDDGANRYLVVVAPGPVPYIVKKVSGTNGT